MIRLSCLLFSLVFIAACSSRDNSSLEPSKQEDKKANTTNEPSVKVDSIQVAELSQYFRQKNDEYANGEVIWFEPKAAPEYVNDNGLFCYFKTVNGVPEKLRFRFQYYAQDRLFIRKIQFLIDGVTYEFIPFETKSDNGKNGKIWEWIDQELSPDDREFIYTLATAKTAKMKIVGRNYFDEKVVTQEQIKSIKQSLDLYRAMGGIY
jgi:hypothetical protein